MASASVITKQPSTQADKPLESKIDASLFRRRRLKTFIHHVEECFGSAKCIRVLDVGGSLAYWQGTRSVWSHLPLDITIVNLGAPTLNQPPYRVRSGDATTMPEWTNDSFDVVHSNSVIEHVGHWNAVAQMADEIRRIAPHYFVQTPNYAFPYEPHFRSLFFHWRSEQRRADILTRKRLGFRGPYASFGEAMDCVQSINLLDRRQMRALFPDARIIRERFFGLSKSMVAIR